MQDGEVRSLAGCFAGVGRKETKQTADQRV